MVKQINILPSGSISDSSLALLGDPSDGALSQITYKSIKNYVQSGSLVSTAEGISVSTGSIVWGQAYEQPGDPAIINTLREIPIDSSLSDGIVITSRNVAVADSSFMMITPYSLQIEGNVSGSLPATFTLSDISGSSLIVSANSLTSSLISYGSSSITLFQNGNVLINQNLLVTGTYPGSASFAAFSASYAIDSSSFDIRIKAISSSYFVFSASYVIDSSSFNTRINNTSSSFGNFSASYVTDSGSFNNRINTVSSSFGNFSASYNIDSASFNTRINTISSSFGGFSASYSLDSASFNTRINSASSSFGTFSASYVIDSGSFSSSISKLSSSFGSFSSSYLNDSASFANRITTESSSFGGFSSSYVIDSSSFNNRINTVSSSFGNFSASYNIDSSSFSGSIAHLSSSVLTLSASLSSSIATISSSFGKFSGSYSIDSASFSGSIAYLSSSFLTFSSSYDTDSGSFSGSIAYLSSSFRSVSSSISTSLATLSGSIPIIGSGQIAYGAANGTVSSSGNLLWTSGVTQSLIVGAPSSSVSSSIYLYGSNFGVNSTSSFILLTNNTPATGTLSQYSPAVMFSGQAWTTAFLKSQTAQAAIFLLPQNGTTVISSEIVFAFATASGPWNNAFQFSSLATNWTFGAAGLTINPVGGAGLSLTSLPATANQFHLNNAFITELIAGPSVNSFGMLFLHAGNASYTSSQASTYLFSGSFAAPSGSGSWNLMNLQAIVNQSGSATGTTRGLFIQLNSTASADFRAIETTTGSLVFAGPMIVNATGSLPTAGLTLGPGSAGVSSAPFKFTSGTLQTTPETGSVEYDGKNLYFVTGSTTRQVILSAYSSSAPANTTTPASWLAFQFSGSFFRIPLYK